MGYFNHNIACKDANKEIKERELQLSFLEGMLKLKKEEVEADFDNLVKEFEEFKASDFGSSNMFERLRELESSLTGFLEVRSEINSTKNEICIAKDDLEEIF